MGKEEILVSVVVPAFNAESTVLRAVESVLSDPVGHKSEVIIVDDGSSDDTAGVVRRLEAIGKKVKFIQSPSNIGANAARNLGLDAARGEFVQFLDADDYILPGKLSRSIEEFDASPEINCVFTNAQTILDGVPLPVKTLASCAFEIADHVSRFFNHGLQTSMPMFRRSFLAEHELRWDESLVCWQEAEFFTRAFLVIGGRMRIRYLDFAGVAISRSERHAGISRGYWSERYIVGQLDAITRIVDACSEFGLPEVEGQRDNFFRVLQERSVVGAQRAAYLTVCREMRNCRDFRDRLRARTPFALYRLAYVVYRFAKRFGLVSRGRVF